MPQFFFHLLHGFTELPDSEGVECANADAATAHGIRIVRDMLAEDIRNGRIDLGWKVRVIDGAGTPVAALTFAEVLAGAQIVPRMAPPPQR